MREKFEFDPIPTADQLAAIQRDLTFTRICNKSPDRLVSKHIDAFNENGFISPLDVFEKTEIGGIREYFDELVEQVVSQGGDSYSISSAHLKYGDVYDILRNEKIVDFVRDLLGNDLIGWGSHFFCKMPRDGKRVAWHQDASYWPMSKSKNVTVWLAIDDADVDNACMKFLAGSHYHGHVTYRPSSPEEHNVLNQTVENPEQYGTIFDNELDAGQISIHSDLLLHSSEANDSDRRRCGLTLRYCSADVRAGLDWNRKGVIVSGSDPSGHWKNPQRPE